MKKYLSIIFFITTAIVGCDDVLDKDQLDAIDDSQVWTDPSVANLFLNRLYEQTLPGFGANVGTNLTEESFGTGVGNMMYGGLQITDAYGNYSVGTYANIRGLNVLLSEIARAEIDQDDIDIIKGQGHFLRAWSYWQLVLYYGGVPLILDPTISDITEIYPTRSSAATCVGAIINDLDTALELLSLHPGAYTDADFGRATTSAIAAFKGRVLLFYASPQFNPDNLQSRWQDAYEANLEAKQICEAAGHGLAADFESIFVHDNGHTEESIFVTIYDGAIKAHGYDNSVRPASVSNVASTTGNPTWDFVKAFPMKDGQRATTSHPDYDSLVFWKDRDPRFYATVAYNSAEWEFAERESDRQWTYVGNSQEPTNGLSRTDFYVRKYVDTSIPRTASNIVGTDWIEIRYAEVLLNLAECANEVGNTSEAYDELIAIRERAGIEPGGDNLYGLPAGMDQSAMREAVLWERQIELAYENKRHWDLRRREMFINGLGPNTPMINGTQRKGIRTVLDTAYIRTFFPGIPGNQLVASFEENIRDTVDWDEPDNYKLYFDIESVVSLDNFPINFLQPKYNFYFIPTSALDRNINLKQTIRWTEEATTFDPLAD